MRSLVIVELEVGMDPFPGLPGCFIFVEVHFLIFEASPEPFGENVVGRSPFPVHIWSLRRLQEVFPVLRTIDAVIYPASEWKVISSGP